MMMDWRLTMTFVGLSSSCSSSNPLSPLLVSPDRFPSNRCSHPPSITMITRSVLHSDVFCFRAWWSRVTAIQYLSFISYLGFLAAIRPPTKDVIPSSVPEASLRSSLCPQQARSLADILSSIDAWMDCIYGLTRYSLAPWADIDLYRCYWLQHFDQTSLPIILSIHNIQS